ncbi:unnamed protein product [Zymoseptoria tritici ST99CH_1A5]|uniref:Small nuclear ribonucleoprotein Prp3 C-terminal domain-containing protein n=3 Tax=Zymoseptoria tritici TaxID=1047171 RepID=F9X4T6_ZYMTI|nr:uncharacterized protein MYCGRDRAFT_103488 [Zymoseptoria tritici IPO323]EGP90171.1 hypothetical protein MYCGRDRAFT_103488 [Zymoseptoria tritici IPO323]SMR47998.1 unnamed protein product [Zymoseptoria tritici ST99CH_3D1]SMY21902.1 unnamed protein product [Zymoseptoria tritici ST99CH_1A5]
MVKCHPQREDVAARLDYIDLLRAMYPADDELLMDQETEVMLSNARTWCEDDAIERPNMTATISLSLVLTFSTAAKQDSRKLVLTIELPLAALEPVSAEVPLEGRLRVGADWLTKAEALRLQFDLPEHDILSAIDIVRYRATEHLATLQQTAVVAGDISGPEVRAWFYFPSISTRAKRDDLVNHAPSFGLTGFLLAGKPGVLCLEGGAQRIDDFMKFIKTESWGDIPPGHKKVSEVLRESCTERSFSRMEEITDQLEKRGQRSNRSDMKGLEQWLAARGLGESFAKVLM